CSLVTSISSRQASRSEKRTTPRSWASAINGRNSSSSAIGVSPDRRTISSTTLTGALGSLSSLPRDRLGEPRRPPLSLPRNACYEVASDSTKDRIATAHDEVDLEPSTLHRE